MIAYVFQKYHENFAFRIRKSSLLFKSLRLNNLRSSTAMTSKISVFVICVEAIIHSLLYKDIKDQISDIRYQRKSKNKDGK